MVAAHDFGPEVTGIASTALGAAGASTADVDNLEAFGLGWRWRWRVERTWVQMTFRNPRRGSSGPNCELTIDASVPTLGMRGTLTVERLTLGDGRARVALANRLEKRTGEGPDAPVDWRAMIDGICSRILCLQQQGPPIKTIGLASERATNWLVSDLVEEHQTTSIYGDGEVGKSWLALAACVSLASGVEIVPGWQPIRRAIPIYLDWETDEETLNARVRQICRGVGIAYTPIQYVFCDGPLIDQVEWLLERVHDAGVELLVVDSVEAAMSGSRSDGGDIHEPAAKVNQLLRKIGRSAILVDHVNAMGAASKGLAGKAFGTIFKRNWVRLSYEVKRVHEGTDGEKHLGIFCTKRNNGPRFDARGLRWTINDERASWASEEITEPGLRAGLSVSRRIEIALLEDSPLSATTLSEVCEAPIGSIRVELSRYKGRKFQERSEGLWELAAAGRARMQIVNAGQEEPDELPFE